MGGRSTTSSSTRQTRRDKRPCTIFCAAYLTRTQHEAHRVRVNCISDSYPRHCHPSLSSSGFGLRAARRRRSGYGRGSPHVHPAASSGVLLVVESVVLHAASNFLLPTTVMLIADREASGDYIQ